MKSQFLGTATNSSYLNLSLNVMVADNRGGLTPETTANLDAMSKYIEANPEQTNKASFNAYREKMTTSAAKQYTATRTHTHTQGFKAL